MAAAAAATIINTVETEVEVPTAFSVEASRTTITTSAIEAIVTTVYSLEAVANPTSLTVDAIAATTSFVKATTIHDNNDKGLEISIHSHTVEAAIATTNTETTHDNNGASEATAATTTAEAVNDGAASVKAVDNYSQLLSQWKL